MIHFDLPKEKSSIIKVIGVGGGGSNAVNHMFSQNIEGVNFIICNTDAQAIAQSRVPNKVQLGPHLTQGLGAGANPDIGRQATEESLEEIKQILEVNTKMAFITAGMGGGTGTGGAPIISKICKDLGILTVGIITTPFSYEGKKRQLQAEEGIKVMKQYVDTLLVISNDKLRHQFGNLKMKEAFAKADNVLATAAKCITDVISTTGQINVDFADVCTVMRNGGVAILGNAQAQGEGRAQRAIEEALNSPLLNDSDIHGAKWILININSCEGEHEFTMDEVEIIQNYLLSHAGESTDVIMGLGYDSSLGANLGITLIATGFEHKDPFSKMADPRSAPKKEEKILMTLNGSGEPRQPEPRPVLTHSEIAKETFPDAEGQAPKETPVMEHATLAPLQGADQQVEKNGNPVKIEWVLAPQAETIQSAKIPEQSQEKTQEKIQMRSIEKDPPVSAVSGGYLARPSNIYDEEPVKGPIQGAVASDPKEDESQQDMQLVFKDDSQATDGPGAHQTHLLSSAGGAAEDPAMQDDADDPKRRAAERINKLRNLSFNINAADPNNEFETVPAYIRRNLELYNTISNVENFYSNYEVKTDENNNTEISTINTFLDGKRPD